MRKLMKFLHTMAAIGFLGAIIGFLVIHTQLPEPTELASELERFAALRMAEGAIAKWVLLPSMGLVLISGLLSMAIVPAYQNQGWVLAKLLTGITIFEGTLVYVQGPMQRAALRAQAALAGEVPVAELGATLDSEWGSFWVIGAVAVANVLLGVWRPRFSRKRRTGSSLGPTDTGEVEEGADTADAEEGGEAAVAGRDPMSAPG